MKLFLIVCLMAELTGCDSAPNQQATAQASPASDFAAETPQATGGRAACQFTKTDLDKEVTGKTKAQIRAEFGSPLVVHEDDDSWYFGDRIAVCDAEAGTAVHASIRFGGLAGPDDPVVDIGYD
jgi:outer membrane protein assembly factor BamE (lipoprotein component of BamABCDE complex)